MLRLKSECRTLRHDCPELGSLEDLPDDLIAREYEVRCSRGMAPSHVDYAGRFGSRASLIDLLCEADAQQQLKPTKGLEAAKSAWVTDVVSRPDQDDGNAAEFGDYVILREIGRGGMGVVFQARQRKTQRIVALKLILAGRLASRQEVNRSYGEARAVAQCHLLWNHLGALLLERRKPPGSPTVIPDGLRRAATK